VYTCSLILSLGKLLSTYSFPVKGEITLVALAPLTNIALALRQDPDLGSKLASLTVMGGNTQGMHGLGLA